MGNGLARQVAAEWGHLPGNAYKVLTYMAWQALDVPNEQGRPARLYFGGIDPLALAIGRTLPDDKAKRKAVHRQIYSALECLEAEGAIERQNDHPHARSRQAYLLRLTKRVSDLLTHRVSKTSTQEGEQNQRKRVSKTNTPRNQEESKRGEDSRSQAQVAASTTDRARDDSNEFNGCEIHPWENRHIEGECFACSTEQSTGVVLGWRSK